MKIKNLNALLMASLLVFSADALHARDDDRAFRGDGHFGGLPQVVAENDDSDNSGSEDDQPLHLGLFNDDSSSEEGDADSADNPIPLVNQDVLDTLGDIASQIPQDYSDAQLAILFPTNFDALKQREYMNQILESSQEAVMSGQVDVQGMENYQKIFFYKDALEAFINSRD